MAEPEPRHGPLRFGNFEVDLRAGELRKAGVRALLRRSVYGFSMSAKSPMHSSRTD